MSGTHGLPDHCGVAFKEWSGVCAALGEGTQALILRKGGIAEGPRGFAPEHDVFWLYPTHVHQAEQGLRTDARSEPPECALADRVEISSLAATGPIAFVDRLEDLRALDDLHVWTAATVEKRFHYRKPGLWVIGVRVFRLRAPVALTARPEFAGCKTWVPIEPPLSTAEAFPVLDDATFEGRMERLRARLEPDR